MWRPPSRTRRHQTDLIPIIYEAIPSKKHCLQLEFAARDSRLATRNCELGSSNWSWKVRVEIVVAAAIYSLQLPESHNLQPHSEATKRYED